MNRRPEITSLFHYKHLCSGAYCEPILGPPKAQPNPTPEALGRIGLGGLERGGLGLGPGWAEDGVECGGGGWDGAEVACALLALIFQASDSNRAKT